MNLPEKANLEKIYGENSACAVRFQNLADTLPESTNMTMQISLLPLEEQKSSETMLTTTAAR